jgi:hypothetical protein
MDTPSYYSVIPANVRYDKRLKPNEKLLFSEITCLTNKNGVCHASNSYFANLYNTSKETISRWVKNLVDCGYIEYTLVYKEGTRQVNSRRIRLAVHPIDEKINTPYQKDQYPIDEKINTPIDEKIKDNNTSNNNTSNNNIKNNKKDFFDAERQSQKDKHNVPSFDDFWNLYDKKVGKVKAEAKFNKLSSDVKERIMSTLPAFLKTITDKKYQPHPTTYLNNMRWEDEIEEPEESLEVRRRREKLIKENPWIAKDFDASKIKFKDTENWDYSTRVKFEKKYPNDYKRVMDEFRFLIQNKVI